VSAVEYEIGDLFGGLKISAPTDTIATFSDSICWNRLGINRLEDDYTLDVQVFLLQSSTGLD